MSMSDGIIHGRSVGGDGKGRLLEGAKLSAMIKDEIANIYADRMNKNIYVLSVIAAVFLPLGFLTGLL